MRADRQANTQAVYAALVHFMSRRDRVCFASNATISDHVRLSVRTVIRILRQLEAEGRIERLDRLPRGRPVKTVVWTIPRGQTRKCHRTPFGRRPEPRRPFVSRCSLRFAPRTPRPGAARRARFQETSNRWRHRMTGDVVPLRKDGQPKELTPGQNLYAAIVDAQNATGAKSPPQQIVRVVKAGKEALAGGVQHEAVFLGCMGALRRSRPDLATQLIGEVSQAMSGEYLTEQQWRQHLLLFNRDSNDDSAELRAAYEKAVQKLGGRSLPERRER